jgi:hypothetical protein
MGLGTNQVTAAVANNFIPELWSDEVIAVYKQKLVLANLVTKISFKGKKGDTLHIPVPARGTASSKVANTQVNLLASTNTTIDVLIDKHYEYSKLYEDIAEMQALSSMRLSTLKTLATLWRSKWISTCTCWALASTVARSPLLLPTKRL